MSRELRELPSQEKEVGGIKLMFSFSISTIGNPSIDMPR
jgi:hypothetical protein